MFEGRLEEAQALAPSIDPAAEVHPIQAIYATNAPNAAGNLGLETESVLRLPASAPAAYYVPSSLISSHYVDLGTAKSSVGFTSMFANYMPIPLETNGVRLQEIEADWIVLGSIAVPSQTYQVQEAPTRDPKTHVKEEPEWAKAA